MSAVESICVSAAGVEVNCEKKMIRYSREALLSLNIQNYDEKTKETILKCLKPYHIDKGNSECIVKTDTTSNNLKKTPVVESKVRPVLAPMTLPNAPTHRALSALSPPVSPVTLHALARTPLATLNNKPQASPLAGKGLPKFQPAPQVASDKRVLKENENNQKCAKEPPKSAQKAFVTPNKKVYVEIKAKAINTPAMAPGGETPSKAAPLVSPVSVVTPAVAAALGASCASTPGSPLSKEAGEEDEDNLEEETDPHRLQQRQKQIDYGYKTLGYIRYRLAVPKEERDKEQPKTPKKNQSCSKRSWDGQVKKWRRDLHLWDPVDPSECEPYFDEKLLNSLFEGTLDIESIKKQLDEQVEELTKHGCLLLSPNDKHLVKKAEKTPDPSSVSSPSSRSLSISDAQPNRIFPSGVQYSDEDEACKVPDYLQKQPIARVLVFPAEC